jgi:hypothetical protein
MKQRCFPDARISGYRLFDLYSLKQRRSVWRALFDLFRGR